MLILILSSFCLGVYVADLQNRKIIEQYKIEISGYKLALESAFELIKENGISHESKRTKTNIE